MSIGYDKKNGVLYAKICTGKRDGGSVKSTQISLGRVLDKERGIYQNRERGVFTYDDTTGKYGTPPSSYVPPAIKRKNAKEKLILDFGDAFFLDSYMKRIGFGDVVDAIGYGNPDTTKAMLLYYLLSFTANCYAETWYSGSYARELYPKANLSSQRVSEFLSVIGEEPNQRAFFKEYFKFILKDEEEDNGIMIDSTGLPNSIHFPLTAVSNHNGKISNETRLIYVVQQGTNMPLFFRYVPGNVVDVSTLTKTIAELKAHSINTKFAIVDAGYLTDEGIRKFNEEGISYLSRMKENRKEYKALLKKHLPTLQTNKENLVRYGDRFVFMESSEFEIAGCKAYGYVAMDINTRAYETSKRCTKAVTFNETTDELFDSLENRGVFVLFSSRKIAKEKVLDTYYTRQQIEQVFDIVKNNTNMLPLRVHTEETFRGHLLLTFVSSAIAKLLQKDLKDSGFSLNGALMNLRIQKCKVFDSVIIPCESVKAQNQIYSRFKMKSPLEIQRLASS
jgi:Transposase